MWCILFFPDVSEGPSAFTGKYISNFVPVHGLKANAGSRGTAPLTPNLVAKWRYVITSDHENKFRYPLDRRLGGPQSRSGRFGEKYLLPLLFGIRTARGRS